MATETGIEIERRFLLKSMPKVGRYDYILQIQQHYLSKIGDRITERIRESVPQGYDSGKYYHTLKVPIEGEFSVKEDESEINYEAYSKMWNLKDRSLYKTRYVFENGPLTWEVDEFDNFQLIIVEVELPSEDFVFEIPDMIKDLVLMEITGMNQFSNSNLAE